MNPEDEKNWLSKAAQIAGEEISKIDSTDVIPPVQMLQILKTLNERRRQDAKWGEQNHNDYYWLGILTEEVGEAAKALIEMSRCATVPYQLQHLGCKAEAHENIQYLDNPDLEKELTHVAAVAIAWLEAIHRRRSER